MTNESRHAHSSLTRKAVLCGSFRRDRRQLAASFDALRAHFEVLSPRSLDFVDLDVEFVRLPDEADQSVDEIEGKHLAAIAEADLVWLHAPNGYVGPSAAMEVGTASALGIPVFAATAPQDATLASFVTVVDSPSQVPDELTPDAGRSIRSLQAYYGRVATRRGWSDESPRDTLLLLTEELGELARAVRKSEGLARDGEWDSSNVGHELADIQLYLLHLANGIGVDLAGAVTEKERINAARVAKRSVA